MSKMTKVIAALGVVAGLGVAAMPLSSYAKTETAQVDVYATVSSALSITAEDATVDLGTIGLNTMKTSAPVKVSVSTSETSYKLEIQGLNGDDEMHEVDENDLPVASGATIAAGDLTGTTSSWGYQLEGATTFNAIPKTAEEIATVTAPAPEEGEEQGGASGVHNVIFGVKIGNAQAEGRYKGSVVFTATAGN